MTLESQLVVRLPEGAHVDLRIAGVASRAVAAAADFGMVTFAILALGSGAVAGIGRWDLPTLSQWWFEPRYAIAALVALVAWPLVWELGTGGWTPGKRLVGLRVVAADGGVLSPEALVVRNLLRVLDVLPVPYGLGLVTALVHPRCQRVGDIVAGTVVVREVRVDRTALAPPESTALRWAAKFAPTDVVVDPHVWDTAGLDAADLRAIRRFLERRWDLPVNVRAWAGDELALRIRDKVIGAPAGLPAEALLEGVVLAGPVGSAVVTSD